MRRWLWMLCLVPELAWATPFDVELERNVNLRLGMHTINERPLPDDIASCKIAFTSDRLAEASVLRLRIEHSVDEGKTWYWAECVFTKVSVGDGTAPAMCELPFQPGSSRLVKGEYEVTGARFRSTVTLSCA